jgi:hypothetical protein
VSSSISVVRKSGTTPTIVSHGAPSRSSSLIRRPTGSWPRSDAPSSRFPSVSIPDVVLDAIARRTKLTFTSATGEPSVSSLAVNTRP